MFSVHSSRSCSPHSNKPDSHCVQKAAVDELSRTYLCVGFSLIKWTNAAFCSVCDSAFLQLMNERVSVKEF